MAVDTDDRAVAFENEKFCFSMLQAVSGGAIVSGLASVETIVELVGQRAFVSYLGVMAAALVAAVLGTYWRYLYKVWDIKARASRFQEARVPPESRQPIREEAF